MIIKATDKHSIYDYSNIGKRNFAKIIINNELVETTFNMVLANGRFFAAQKLFGKYPVDNPDYTNYNITHFGIGSGGTLINSDSTVVLTGPNICDTDLVSPIQIEPGNNSFLTCPSGTQYVCKAIENDGSIEFVNNNDINCPNNLSIVKCNCTINRSEPSFLQPGQSVKVDEAVLYFTYNSQTQAYARITFAPKYIEISTLLIIEWYVIC